MLKWKSSIAADVVMIRKRFFYSFNAWIKRTLHRSVPLEWVVRDLRPEHDMANCSMPCKKYVPQTPRLETWWLAENRKEEPAEAKCKTSTRNPKTWTDELPNKQTPNAGIKRTLHRSVPLEWLVSTPPRYLRLGAFAPIAGATTKMATTNKASAPQIIAGSSHAGDPAK
jgi:hypothetical protein